VREVWEVEVCDASLDGELGHVVRAHGHLRALERVESDARLLVRLSDLRHSYAPALVAHAMVRWMPADGAPPLATAALLVVFIVVDGFRHCATFRTRQGRGPLALDKVLTAGFAVLGQLLHTIDDTGAGVEGGRCGRCIDHVRFHGWCSLQDKPQAHGSEGMVRRVERCPVGINGRKSLVALLKCLQSSSKFYKLYRCKYFFSI
jgi:hypothetical protein